MNHPPPLADLLDWRRIIGAPTMSQFRCVRLLDPRISLFWASTGAGDLASTYHVCGRRR